MNTVIAQQCFCFHVPNLTTLSPNTAAAVCVCAFGLSGLLSVWLCMNTVIAQQCFCFHVPNKSHHSITQHYIIMDIFTVRSARVDVCRRVTENVGVLLT